MKKDTKQIILSKAQKKLKKEFFGIDEEINQIINLITPWYLNPELYNTPLIINLWGMTGTGKTHLVRRLVELLDFKKNYKEFELSNMNNTGSFNRDDDLFNDLYEFDNKQSIILFDEFQKSQTVNKISTELTPESSHLRELWSLLSDGVIRKHINFKNDFFSIAEMLNSSDSNQKPRLTSWLIPALEKHYQKKGLEFFKDLKSNPQKVFEHYIQAKKNSNGLEERNLKKSLIFICGNMDEPFMQKNGLNIDPDFLSANELHEISKDIDKNDIKESLLNLFRFEQVSRMGYNHIVFKSLSKKDCLRYIKRLLNDFSKKIKKGYNKKIVFSKRMEEILFIEGYIPSQGTRNLMSSIHHFINPILSEIIDSNKNTINIDVDPDKGLIYIDKQKIKHSFDRYNQLNKINRDKEFQKIISIHESGHLLAGLLNFNKLPEKVFSQTSNKNILGFVYFKEDKNSMSSKKSLLKDIDYILGGYAAEKILLKGDNLTVGSSSDLKKATALASSIIKKFGMGSHISVSESKAKDHYSSHTSSQFEKSDDLEIESILKESVGRNIVLFNKNLDLMNDLVSHLKIHTSLNNDDLKKILKKHKLVVN